MKKSEDRFLEKIQDVEKILQEKTKAFECGGKTVEIVEYDLADESGMLGPNQTNGDEEEDETQESRTEVNTKQFWKVLARSRFIPS